MYRAEITYEYADFLGWNKVYAKTANRKLRIALKVLFAVILLIFAGCMVFLIIIDEIDPTVIVGSAFVALAVIVMLFKNRINAKISQSLFIKDIGTEIISFDEDAISVKNNKAEGKNYYSGIYAVYADNERFYLLLDKRHALILPKKCMTGGDPEAFAGFISEKTGLEVKYIKC